MGLARFRDDLAAVQSLAVTAVVVAGAAWAVWNFALRSEPGRSLSVSQDVTRVEVNDQTTLLRVVEKIRNLSDRSWTLGCVRLESQRLLPLSEDNQAALVNGVKKNDVVFDLDVPYILNMPFVNANITVPAKAETTWVQYVFYNNYFGDQKDRNKLLTINATFYVDSDCKQDAHISDSSLIDVPER